jgi:hypothetical protein
MQELNLDIEYGLKGLMFLLTQAYLIAYLLAVSSLFDR